MLDYDEVMEKFDRTMEWLARTYVHAMNCIHYMHDKYFYERLEMALHDRDILRTMAFGIAGLSVVADSLAAIKYAKVHVIRDKTGLAVDYRIEGTGHECRSPIRQQRRSGGLASPPTSSPDSCRRSASIRPIATRPTPRAC